MRLRDNKGFTLVEIIIVVLLIGIVAVPIIDGFFQSVRLNKRSLAIKDATFLAQKYSEIIQNEGVPADFTVSGSVSTKEEQVNGRDYTITCSQVSNAIISTGTYIQQAFRDEHWKFDSTAANTIEITREKIGDDGTFEVTDNTQSPYTTTNSENYSIVIDSSGITLYENNQYPGGNEWEVVRSDFQGTPRQISTSNKNVYLTETDSNPARVINVNIYNNSGSDIHVFYSAAEHIKLHYKMDTDIFVHEISGITGAAVKGSIASRTYQIAIKQTDAPAAEPPLLTRKVTQVN